MKIIPTRITTFIENSKYEKEKKFLNKYVSLDWNLDDATYNKLCEARKTIANYVAPKGVTVEISDPRRLLTGEEPAEVRNYLGTKLNIEVKDMLTGEVDGRLLSSQVDNMYPYKTMKIVVVDNLKDDLQEGYEIVGHEYQEPFLRYIYRNIVDMVNNIQKRK